MELTTPAPNYGCGVAATTKTGPMARPDGAYRYDDNLDHIHRHKTGEVRLLPGWVSVSAVNICECAGLMNRPTASLLASWLSARQ
jgi:hypothetical protein